MGKAKGIVNEALFNDEEDRERIMSMPEVEREKIIFERQQKLEEAAEKQRLIAKVKALEEGESGPRSVSAPTTATKVSAEKQTLSPEDYNAFCNVVLSRKFIEAYAFHPSFAQIAKGCFVRLALERGVYRLCEIVKIVSMPAYKLEADVLIDKGALLRQGKSEKEFKFDVISNSNTSNAEIDYFVSLETHKKVKMSALHAKAREVEEFKRRPLQDDILELIILEKKRVRGYGGIKEKVKLLAEDERVDAKKSRDFKYNSHSFLKLEATSNDPNDPFARRKYLQSQSTKSSQPALQNEETFEFKFSPQAIYELHDFELDCSSVINSLF